MTGPANRAETGVRVSLAGILEGLDWTRPQLLKARELVALMIDRPASLRLLLAAIDEELDAGDRL